MPKHILIIDDDAAIGDMLSEALTREAFGLILVPPESYPELS